jgi:Zn-dependent protease
VQQVNLVPLAFITASGIWSFKFECALLEACGFGGAAAAKGTIVAADGGGSPAPKGLCVNWCWCCGGMLSFGVAGAAGGASPFGTSGGG